MKRHHFLWPLHWSPCPCRQDWWPYKYIYMIPVASKGWQVVQASAYVICWVFRRELLALKLTYSLWRAHIPRESVTTGAWKRHCYVPFLRQKGVDKQSTVNFKNYTRTNCKIHNLIFYISLYSEWGRPGPVVETNKINDYNKTRPVYL